MLHLTYHRATRTPTINFLFFLLFKMRNVLWETFALPGTQLCNAVYYICVFH